MYLVAVLKLKMSQNAPNFAKSLFLVLVLPNIGLLTLCSKKC